MSPKPLCREITISFSSVLTNMCQCVTVSESDWICIRFLKSEVYKDCIRAEMAGCPDQTSQPAGLSLETPDLQTPR